MPEIHPTAVVSRRAELCEETKVGPYAVIEDDVKVGQGSVIMAHAVLRSGVSIGSHSMIGEHTVLGGLPQDTRFKGEQSFLRIGDNVLVREFASLHRATGEGASTSVGNGTYIMAYSHVSHNCKVGEGVVLANDVQLAGHVEVGDGAFIGGSSGVHQFVRIGRLSMLGAHSYLNQDLAPFLLGSGHPFEVVGINRIGLERAGFNPHLRTLLKKLYRLIYRDPRPRDAALAGLSSEELGVPEVQEFLRFISKTRRGVRLKIRITHGVG